MRRTYEKGATATMPKGSLTQHLRIEIPRDTPDERSGEVAVLHAAAAATDAYEWLQGHARQLERYAGRWIAVTSRGVLADAASLPQLRQITDISGLSRKEIVVFRLPTADVKKIVRNRRF